MTESCASEKVENKEYIIDQVIVFGKTQAYKNAMFSGAEFLESGNVEAFQKLMLEAFQKG